MPWKETDSMLERCSFIAEHARKESSMTELCAQYEVSRKTGYKWLKRFDPEASASLVDRSKVAHSRPHRTSDDIETLLVLLKTEYPTWGPKKLVALMQQRWPELDVPAASTAQAILGDHQLVERCPQRGRKGIVRATALIQAQASNDCMSIDHKGHFALGDGSRCYPLTIIDNYSRHLHACEALTGTDTALARRVIERCFRESGLPLCIRTDNGSPFCSNRGLCLSALSVWWMRLGIKHERITPGRPQQNGRIERMHRVLKAETATEPAANLIEQQRRFDRWRPEYNLERPHEALNMRTPESVYVPSPRQLPDQLPPLSYPPHYLRRTINESGQLCFEGNVLFISEVLRHEDVGLEHFGDERVRIWAGHLPLGFLDLRSTKFVIYDEAEQLTVT